MADLVDKSRSSDWEMTTADLAVRGVTLDAILEFYLRLFGGLPTVSSPPATSTTRDVVFEAVIPLTKQRLCSYATLANEGISKRPQHFVTHQWDSPFGHTVAAMVADALGIPSYGPTANQLRTARGTRATMRRLRASGHADQVYWFCCFSVNQHRSVCNRTRNRRHSATKVPYPECGCDLQKVTTGDLSEINKFAAMMSHLHQSQGGGLHHIISVGPNLDLFTRAWCVAELVEARRLGMPQELKLHSHAALEQQRTQLGSLDVRHCRASDPADLEAILASIPDVEAFNGHLRDLLLDSSTGLLPSWHRAMPNYLLSWDRFSPEYVKQLAEASKCGSAWQLLALLVLPCAVLVPMLAFLPLPGADAEQSRRFLAPVLLCPVCVTVATLTGTAICASALQVDYKQLDLRWVGLFVGGGFLLNFAAWTSWIGFLDIWPVPWFNHVISTPLWMAILPCMWLSVPRLLRSDAAFRRRTLVAFSLAFAVAVLWINTGPLLTAAITLSSSPCVHTLIAVALLGQKLASERLVHVAARYLSPDILLIFVWVGATSYELLLSVALCRGGSLVLFGELVGFDVLENCYHLWSLVGHLGLSAEQQGGGCEAAVTEAEVSGREQLIVSQLLLREVAELISPLVLLISVSALHLGPQWRLNDLVCAWDSEGFTKACKLLFFDFGIEVLMALAVWLVLRRLGQNPWQLLKGVVNKHFIFLVLFQSTNLMMRLSEQHFLTGSDYSFEFKWIKHPGTEWECGLRWK